MPGARELSLVSERFFYFLTDGLRQGRGQGIANHATGGGLAWAKGPGIRKALQARQHARGQARHAHKVRGGRLIGYACAINPELSPDLTGSGRA